MGGERDWMECHDRQKGRSQVTFVFRPEGQCRRVAVAGSFNNWRPEEGRMIRQKDGSFRKRVNLQPGEYTYKFLVDDQWVLDPDDEAHVPNRFGTTDCLLKIP